MTADRPQTHRDVSWITEEFRRTGLPQSALAEYLGLHKSAVTRILNRSRHMDASEIEVIAGLFSVVPHGTASAMTDAVARLQSVKARLAATEAILAWLETTAERDELRYSFVDLIRSQVNEAATLRADQIVALCRVFSLDLRELVGGVGAVVEPRSWPTSEPPPSKDARRTLEEAARRWVREAMTAPYEFERGRPSKLDRPIISKRSFLALNPVELEAEAFKACDAFDIEGSSSEPLFKSGQTVYVDSEASEHLQKGKLVAVFVGDLEAAIGFIVKISQSAVTVDLPSGKRLEIKEPRSTRAIRFCRF